MPEGARTKCVCLANILVMRLLYMPPGQFGLCMCMASQWYLNYALCLSLSLYYSWQRGVHFIIEQPMSSARALDRFTVVIDLACLGHVCMEAYGPVSGSEWSEDWAVTNN